MLLNKAQIVDELETTLPRSGLRGLLLFWGRWRCVCLCWGRRLEGAPSPQGPASGYREWCA